MSRMTIRDKEGNALLAPEYEELYTSDELIDILIDRLAMYEDGMIDVAKFLEGV